MKVNVESIPQELVELDQWVAWRWQRVEGGGQTKVPLGRSNDPKTWKSLADALLAKGADGVGFVFSADDPYVGVDLDDCLEGEELHPAVVELLDLFGPSYTEISPSGTGVKVIARGEWIAGTRHTTRDTAWGGELAAYTERRFFTVTGDVIGPGTHEQDEFAVIQHGDMEYLSELLGEGASAGVEVEEVAEELPPSDDLLPPRVAERLHEEPGDRSGQTLGFVTTCIRAGLSPGETVSLALNRHRPTVERLRDRGEAHVRADVERCIARARADAVGAEVPDMDGGGMAQLFSDKYGLRFRHVTGRGWIRCDGGRWRDDESQQRTLAMERTIESVSSYAKNAHDKKLADNLRAFAHTAKQDGFVRGALNLAVPRLDIDRALLDTDEMLLGVGNGTLDLRTGELRANDPDDLITCGTPTDYAPDANAERWERFLLEVFGEDEELVSYMRRVAGYSLTGSTKEEKLWVLYGGGRNGKSKFADALRDALGRQLCIQTSFSTFATQEYEQHPTAFADLDGTRLVFASETTRARRLDEAVIKSLTGGDPIRARFMRENFFEFLPTFKIMLLVNHMPQVQADRAMAERVKMVPFLQTFVNEPGEGEQKADPDLREKLHVEREGILAWAVRGCLEWQEVGLGSSAAVTLQTSAYMAEASDLHDFLARCCELGKEYVVERGELYERYERFCRSTNEPRLPDGEWKSALQAIGMRDARLRVDGKQKRVWRGLRLRETAE